MIDTPDPSALPASVPASAVPTPPAPRPRRWDWRPKARWFAAEYLIVVLGVLTAVGINSWWGERQDRLQEAAYLRQLDADFDQTERVFDEAEPGIRQGDHAAAALFRPFRTGERPPADSVYLWLGRATFFNLPYAVTQTAEALVTTGDLTLVRDDSLRAAITDYLALWERSNTLMRSNGLMAIDYARALGRSVDLSEAVLVPIPDGVAAANAAGYPNAFPEGATEGAYESPFPLDVDAFYADREVYDALWGLYLRRFLGRRNREGFRQDLDAIRERMDRAAPRDLTP